MTPGRPEEPRQSRGNVVPMRPRPATSEEVERKAAPPGNEHAEAVEEPGYGHGV